MSRLDAIGPAKFSPSIGQLQSTENLYLGGF